MIYSFNPFMSINICVNFRDLNCQHMCRDNKSLQIIKQCANKQYICLLCKQCLILRNSNKHFQQYTIILYSMNFVIAPQYITLYLFIQDGRGRVDDLSFFKYLSPFCFFVN